MKQVTNWTITEDTKEHLLSFFDFETFPNYWLCVFATRDGIVKVDSDMENWRALLIDNVVNKILVGYNIKRFDLMLMNSLIDGKYTPQELYELVDNIISRDETKKHPYNNYFYWNKYQFIDLYDDYAGSLKEFESNNGMMIKESDVEFTKANLTEEEKEEIFSYCKQDVKATVMLFRSRYDYIQSKLTLADMFNIPLEDVCRATNAKLAALILKPRDIRLNDDLCFVLPDNCADYIRQWTPPEIVEYYTKTPVKNIEKTELELFDNKIILGSGGLHSTHSENIVVESNDEKILVNYDAFSFYPSLIIQYNYLSRKVIENKHLYPQIFKDRIAAKKAGDKAKANAYKLILNTVFGAQKDKFNKLYDFYQASNICILGQLLLLSLANELYTELGVITINGNTDGILLYLNKSKLEQVRAIVHKWEQMTRFEMEEEHLLKFIQRDVNNYIEVKKLDDFKLKGKWCNQADGASNNLNAPITHQAIFNYYVYETPVADTINNGTDLLDYCFTCKTGFTYEKTYHVIDGQKMPVNKVNRVVATTDERYGTLYKYKKEEVKKKKQPTGEIRDRFDKQAEISEHVKIVNDELKKYNMADLEIDYQFYIDFATNKILEMKIL